MGASRASTVAGVGHERGRCLPTVHDAIEPLTSLSPLPLALGLTHLRACSLRKYRSRSFGVARGSLGRESRQDHFPRRLVKGDASHDPGCLPSVRTLRRIRWPLVRAHWPYARFAAPVPRPHPRFWRRCDRWMKLSLHPGSSSEPHRYIDARPDSRSIPSPTQAPTFHRRRSPRLGPRSLDADRPFWSALPSLFEARCRLPTSANCVSTTCGREPVLFNPRRDGGQDLLPFLTRHRLLPCGSGDARRAALRPVCRAPPPVPPGCPGLPDVDARPTAPPTTCLLKARRSVVTIDAHVSKDRVKDASS